MVERKSPRLQNVLNKETVKEERPSIPKMDELSDGTILKPSADPEGLLCFAALVPIMDTALEKGFEVLPFESPCLILHNNLML